MSGSPNPGLLRRDLESSGEMLRDAQRLIDDGLAIAAILVALDRGHDPEKIGFSIERATHIAQGIMASHDLVLLASYLHENAIDKMDKPTRGGLVRHISGVFDD